MSRKITTIAATGITALSLAVTGATLAGAAPAPSSHTLKFTSVQTAQRSVGKYKFIDSDKDVQSGKVIGYDAVDGAYHPKTHTITVAVAAALKGGILYVAGTGDVVSGKFAGKITGGTGTFKGVHGTVTGQATGKQGQNERLVIVYH